MVRAHAGDPHCASALPDPQMTHDHSIVTPTSVAQEVSEAAVAPVDGIHALATPGGQVVWWLLQRPEPAARACGGEGGPGQPLAESWFEWNLVVA